MSDKRFAMIFLRLGLLASVIFAAFWGIWQLSGHQVPTYMSLNLTKTTSLTFPFSRWWDIPFAFLMVNICAWILRIYYKFSLKFIGEDFDKSPLIGLIIGFVIGLGVGFINGFIIGFVVGLGLGLVIGFGVGLFTCLCLFIIDVLFSFKFWKSIYNWFAAKNTN